MDVNRIMYINQKDKRIKFNIRQHIIPVIALNVTAFLAYGLFYAPILYGDDWSFVIGRWYGKQLQWLDLTTQRPLEKGPLLILYTIFGLNINAFYIVLWTLNILAAILLYFLVLRLVPRRVLIAFAIAALTLVYPADFTHMWLTMIIIRLVVVLILIYAHLLLSFANTRRNIYLWIALLCLVIALGLYEGPLGIAMAWCLWIFLLYRSASWKTSLSLLWPLAVGIIFVSWRMFGSTLVVTGGNYVTQGLVFSPIVLVQRLILGYRGLVWAWIEPLIFKFGFNWKPVVIVLLAMGGSSFIVYLISRIYPKIQGRYLKQTEYQMQMQQALLLFLVGNVFIVAGYFPVITVFQPTLLTLHSRTNLFTLPGASAVIIGLLAIVMMLLTRKQPLIDSMVLASAIPLIILGIITQAQVQHDNRVAWGQQKQIWQELFNLAPDLTDGTHIYFVIPEDGQQWRSFNRNGIRPPFRANWEIIAALNVLYGKNLGGDIFIKEELLMENKALLNWWIASEGVRNRWTDEITPYERAIFMTYDGNLQIIENLQAEHLVDFQVDDYAPYERIIEIQTSHTDLRWLVGVAP